MSSLFDREPSRQVVPQRFYACIDDVEPHDDAREGVVRVMLDAVDADWDGFAEGFFNLDADDIEQRVEEYWRLRFEGGATAPDAGYDRVPAFRIELVASLGDGIHEAIFNSGQRWLSLELSDAATGIEADIYASLFAAPVVGHFRAISTNAPSAQLEVLFNMTTWPTASEDQLIDALSSRCRVEALVCFDIGQGSASALLCRCGMPVYYFDTGRGSGRNAPTAPAHVDFCTCDGPAIIMSHWDTDHWIGASRHPRLQGLSWIVPRQAISHTHVAFAEDVFRAGGRILVVDVVGKSIKWSGHGQRFELQRANGTGRNGSGLVLVVNDGRFGRSWVLTGDAGYNQIAQKPAYEISAMVVPHHGADMGALSVPFKREKIGYARLLYSFGPGNNFGRKSSPVSHPVSSAIAAHVSQGWDHGSWATTAAATLIAGGDVVATATHPATHLNGCAAGWVGPPLGLGHLDLCPNAMPVPQR